MNRLIFRHHAHRHIYANTLVLQVAEQLASTFVHVYVFVLLLLPGTQR